MKGFAAFLALTSLPLFALEEIGLPPAGSDSITPLCRVSGMGTSYFIYVGSDVWTVVDGFDAAMRTLLELTQAGICR